jgi:hypothetical protein
MYKTLIPAYGRDYTSGKAAKADFLAGKDFIIADITDPYDGKPCSVRDFDAGTGITLRYKALASLTCLKVPKGMAHAEPPSSPRAPKKSPREQTFGTVADVVKDKGKGCDNLDGLFDDLLGGPR